MTVRTLKWEVFPIKNFDNLLKISSKRHFQTNDVCGFFLGDIDSKRWYRKLDALSGIGIFIPIK